MEMEDSSPDRSLGKVSGHCATTRNPSQSPTHITGSGSQENARMLSTRSSASKEKSRGCSHYTRNCALLAPCCNTFYTCRICHDDASNHELNRHSVKHVKCLLCEEVQPVARECRKCGTLFAEYFCPTCRLYSDLERSPIFHCSDCGICRRGTRESIVHCHICRSCVQADTIDKHRCRAGALHDDCPICLERMFDSRDPVYHLPCAHALHGSCFNALMKWDYRCPVCLKAVVRPTQYYASIRESIERQRLNPTVQYEKVSIFCNDCRSRSVTEYHPLHLECQMCHGYNTGRVRGKPDLTPERMSR